MGLRERPVLYKMRVGIVSLQRVPTLYGVIRQIVLVFVVCWLVFVGLVGGWSWFDSTVRLGKYCWF